MKKVICKKAKAKINLNLQITGKRADGYHLLSSLIVFTDLGDELCFEESDRLELLIKGDFAEGLVADENNSVIRAAKGLAKMCGVPAKAKITLLKNLPVAAGIGGGTADAAAALKGLCDLWQVKPEEKDLYSLALSIGADVPASLYGKAVIVSGIGEGLSPAAVVGGEVYVLLVNPREVVPTKEIFNLFGGCFSKPFVFKKQYASVADLAEDLRQTSNDLYAPAVKIKPVIGEVLRLLKDDEKCLFASMSGSGATCFGLYKSEKDAGAAAEKITKKEPLWWAAATKISNS